MKIAIKINENTGDKELFLEGEFIASWNSSVDDMSIIIPCALDEAFSMGEDSKRKQILSVLGLS